MLQGSRFDGSGQCWGTAREKHEVCGNMTGASRQEGRERASGKSISKEAPAALHPVLWEWEDCMTWSETLFQHPADCTAKQMRVSHRHGGEGEERKLCIPEGLCLGPAGFTTVVQGLQIGSMKV